MANEEKSSGRRSYSAPEIQVHGHVRAVTTAAGSMSKNGDGAAMGTSKTF